MTLKKLIRERRTYDIELIVWNDKRNHVICNPFGLPHSIITPATANSHTEVCLLSPKIRY